MRNPTPLNVGMIGGGSGSFIGTPHQRAIHFDGTRRLTAVALRSDPAASREDAANWPYPVKGYENYDAMIADQASLPEEDRLDYILIVTPNHAHLGPCLKALDAGIPVLCEKPLTLTLKDADRIVAKVKETKLPFCVAHTYIGHWSSWFSRWIVESGLLGDVRWVDSHYLQGWLADKLEDKGQTQASWRTDPGKAGASGAGGDIGTHALMQLRFLTGLDVTEVSAHLECMVPGRAIDDHLTVYGKLSNGGKCLLRASQICHGHLNDLGIEVVGTEASLVWRQEDAEFVTIKAPGQPDRIYSRGAVTPHDGFLPDLPDWLVDEPTVPPGHIEGFHDAFARLHREFEKDVRAHKAGKPWDADGSRYANVKDGRMGLAFLEACLASQSNGNTWSPVNIAP